MNQKYEQLKQYIEKSEAIGAALSLFSWDNETLTPKNSMEKTSKIVGILSSEYFDTVTNKEVEELLEQLKEDKTLTKMEQLVVSRFAEDVESLKVIPQEDFATYSELRSKAGSIWADARANNDFQSFESVLKEIIEYNKKFARLKANDKKPIYDVKLDEYEKNFYMEDLDKFFAELKRAIVPLVKEIKEKGNKIQSDFLFFKYDIEKQKIFNKWITEYMGFDYSRGVLGESEHPFTINLHVDDVRMTTHYFEDNVESAIFSSIHECGHALYEQGIDKSYALTPVGQGASCATHESQSRFFENIIGRSRSFWVPIYSKLVELFPENLGNVSLDDFVKAINRVHPDEIRTEADELTYCLHIMVRYEIEKKIFQEDYPVEKLPELWNQLYEEYLGIVPESDSVGILQDVHWSGGMFGYFPSYALGNAFSAQIYYQMKKDIPVETLLEEGKITEITDYLRTRVHQYGRSKTARELLFDITGEEFNPKYYIDYLTEKYRNLYGL